MDEPSGASTLPPYRESYDLEPDRERFQSRSEACAEQPSFVPSDTETSLLNGVAVEVATLVPVIKVENDYYFDLKQTGDLHSIAESILEATVASNYSIYAPRGAAPLTPYNVTALTALREWEGGSPFLLAADPTIVQGVLARESAHGEYGGYPDTTDQKNWAEPATWAEEVAKPPPKGPWMKRWIVLFGAWIGLLLNGFIFNSATLLIPYLDAHSATKGTGVLCITMLNTAWVGSSGLGTPVTRFMGVKLTMLIFTILMAAVLLVSASTAVPIALYACFFALGMLSSIVYICSLSVQTDWFPGKLLGLSYGITQTGVGLGVNLISVVLPLLGKQDFYSVVYMASTFLVCTGVMSALLLDQHVPGHIFEVLGGLKRRWRRQDTPTVGDYVPFPAGTDSKADIEITSKTGTKGEVEANAKASPTGLASFRSTFGHPSVVYLLLATFFFAVHHLGVVTTLTRLMAARGYADDAADALKFYFLADLIMRMPTGVILAKVGEFRTMFSVFVVGTGLCVAIAYVKSYYALVALSAALGAMSAASLVSFNAVAPVVVGYEHAVQLLGISYSVVWTLPALTVMPIIELANPMDLDYKYTFILCGVISALAAISTGVAWFYSNRRGSQIHPQVARDAWVLVPVPIADDVHITDTRYSDIRDTDTRYSGH